MWHVAAVRLFVIFGGLAGCLSVPLVREDHHDEQRGSTQQQGGREEEPIFPSCRVAISISGDARSFVDPAVHRSFRRYVVEPIENASCLVDVFAYAMLGESLDSLSEDSPKFGQDVAHIEASIKSLAPTPTQLVWHQDQAGIIRNSCSGSTEYHRDGIPSPPDSLESQEDTRSAQELAYWRLYGSLAAYRMALRKESEKNEKHASTNFSYDWIVSTRFDIAWMRAMPSLRTFSPEMVWFGSSTWPMNDDFALVPRAFAERFFAAIAAFHSCDGEVWPPGESWWQQDCVEGGAGEEKHGWIGGFLENVLFRHLHAQDVAYRPYSMFDYYAVRPPIGADGEREGNGDCVGGTVAEGYRTACTLIGAAGLLQSTHTSAECASALSGYSNLRCQSLVRRYRQGSFSGRSSDEHNEKQMSAAAETFFHQDDPSSWKGLIGEPHPTQINRATDRREHEEDANDTGFVIDEESIDQVISDKLSFDQVRSKLVALRDAVVIPGKHLQQMATEAAEALNSDATEPRQGRQDTQQQRRNLRKGQEEPGTMKSESEVEEERTQHSWTIRSQKGCRIGEYPGRAPHIVRLYSTTEKLVRELSLATKCLAHRLAVGAEPAAGGEQHDSARMCEAGIRPLELVMIDVAFHSEELGVCTADGASGLTASENVHAFFASPVTHCVGYGALLDDRNKTAAVEGFPPRGPRETADAIAEDLDSTAREVGSEVLANGIGESDAEATEPAEPTPFSDPATGSACPELLVQEMQLLHPKEGAVYWEGPVNVTLEVTLVGPGLEGLALKHVHACADTEVSWPIQDWSRFCVSLEELGSPMHQPSLVFGSTIGVVEGSVSLIDARPGCFPEGSPRGAVLPMVESVVSGDRKNASKSVRFKIIHHEFLFQRRGRPYGPSPLGRGLMAAEDFIQHLEQEAEDEASAVSEEMESYLNLSHGADVELTGACTTRLDMNSRSSSLVTSGLHVQFYIEQLGWMISEGKLPKQMEFAVQRMHEMRPIFPADSADAFASSWVMLKDYWRSVGPFFKKNLLLPMPAAEKVVSTAPLHTWEYDEIPWMKALNPDVDWHAVEEAYLGNSPVPITSVDGFFSQEALDILLDLARSTSIFVDDRINYIGAYPSEGMSHPVLYQIAEEAAERLPRILGRGTPGWPLTQMWFYIYGGNDERRCTGGIKAHADTAAVNLNVWLAPDSANLGSVETDDGGGLTVFHAKPPADWLFSDFNADTTRIENFLREHEDPGNTSVPNRQNRALLFDSMLFHQSNPFRFKRGFENRRLNLTLLFGRRNFSHPTTASDPTNHQNNQHDGAPRTRKAEGKLLLDTREAHHPTKMREVPPGSGHQLHYCL